MSQRGRFLGVTALAACSVLACALAGCAGSGAGTSTGVKTDAPGQIQFGGRTRTCLLHVPPGYGKGGPAPLVIVLHGGTGNAAHVVTTTGLDATSDKHGFIAVYPNGTGLAGDRLLTWNVLFGFGYALRNNVDDVGFIRALIADLEGKYSIDPRRVYATGISNGAMLAFLLGSDLSDVVAAVAPVEGAIGASPTEGAPTIIFPAPAHPVSVIMFNGRKDLNVPYGGGMGQGLSRVIYVPVSTSLGRWTVYDSCSGAPDTVKSSDGNVRIDRYTGGRQGTEVDLVTIENGTHTWPQGDDFPVTKGVKVSGNELIWRFFSAHPKS